MSERRNDYWLESENVAGCECCAWYVWRVMGFDAAGDWVEYGPYSYRDLAEEKLAELEGVLS